MYPAGKTCVAFTFHVRCTVVYAMMTLKGTAAVASNATLGGNSDTQCHIKLILCALYMHSGKLKVKEIWLYGAQFGLPH